MCGSGSWRHTTSGGLSPSGKVTSLANRNQGVGLAPSSSRVKIPGNPGTLEAGAMAANPAMVSQVNCTGVRVRVGCKVGVLCACVWAVGKAGDGAGGNVFDPCCLVPAVPAWRACVGACLSGAACLVLYWGSRCSLFAWTCKRATEGTRVLMLSSIWSS